MNNYQDPRNRQNINTPLETTEVKRTYTPEEAGHEKHRRPVSRASYNMRRRRRPTVNVGVLLIVLVFALVIAVCTGVIIAGVFNGEGGGEETDGGIVLDTGDVAETTENNDPYFKVTLQSEEVNEGPLILVNSYNEYLFPESMEQSIVSIADCKNEYYGMSSYSTSVQAADITVEAFNKLTADYYNETGFKWLQVNSAYRSKEAQETLYAQYERDYGPEYAAQYVANPGESEHHTGLGIDLNVNREGTVTYVESDEGCAWFRENCQQYGFILRYPKDKVHLTGINHESWHYRYVGVPHAQIMEDMNFCLEEYTDYLKLYTYDGNCLGYSEETGAYEMKAEEFYEAESGIMIYYVEAAEGETSFLVPKDCTYTVSGNNVDGFVVTCTK